MESKNKKSNLKIRKYADFFPEKNKQDKELLELFFGEDGFQNDALGLTPLSATETIKSALLYFKKHVLDSSKQDKKDNEKHHYDVSHQKVKETVLNLE